MAHRSWLLRLYQELTQTAEAWGAVALAERYRVKRALSRGFDSNGLRKNHPATFASSSRPPQHVIWVHAASLGEALSVKQLVRDILDEGSRVGVVMTFSSASVLAVLPASFAPNHRSRLVFQMVPLDFPIETDLFLDHWQPRSAVFVESDLWPNLLGSARRRGIPLVLVQARLSPRSFQRWTVLSATRNLLSALVGCFDLIVAQSQADQVRFAAVSPNQQTIPVFNLKKSFPPGCDQNTRIGNYSRNAWVAGSTHPGEEEDIGEVHCMVRGATQQQDLLTIIAPRHPACVPQVIQTLSSCLKRHGLSNDPVVRWSGGALLGSNAASQILVVDGLGSLRELYSCVDIAFVGASLRSSAVHGQHNVWEPLRAGCRLILQGDACASGDEEEFVTTVTDAENIAMHLRRWFSLSEKKKKKIHQQKLGDKTKTLDNGTEVFRLCRPVLFCPRRKEHGES